jgi:hypothetical protein
MSHIHKSLTTESRDSVEQNFRAMRYESQKEIARKFSRALLRKWGEFERELFSVLRPIAERFDDRLPRLSQVRRVTRQEKQVYPENVQALAAVAQYLTEGELDALSAMFASYGVDVRDIFDQYLREAYVDGLDLAYDWMKDGHPGDRRNIASRQDPQAFEIVPATSAFDPNSPFYRQFFNEGLDRVTAKVSVFFRDQAFDIIASGLANGDDWQAIGRTLYRGIGSGAQWHWRRLIRTELAIAYGQSARERYAGAGISYVKLSLARGACPVCTSARGIYQFGQEPRVPFHPNCYSEDTEVLTKGRGFVLFKNLHGGEKIASVHPEKMELEFVPWVKFISYHYKGEMYSFKSRSFDLLVTPGHNMLIKSGKGMNTPSLRSAESIANMHEWRIPRSATWSGNGDIKKLMNLNGLMLDREYFFEFMGYYLSEGSTCKRSSGELLQTSIHQKDNETRQNIFVCAKKMMRSINGKGVSIGKEKVYISNQILSNYLSQFGHSHKKYVPEDIKCGDKNLISKFLIAYAVGDGSIRETTWKAKSLTFTEIELFTSSKRMADDLGEMIIKAGGYPSYAIQKAKGIAVKHKNGTYVGNHDIIRIRWNKAKHAQYCKSSKSGLRIEKHKYDGMVYDVELDRNHVLLVRRNGKVAWSGNCRCSYVPYYRLPKNETARGPWSEAEVE